MIVQFTYSHEVFLEMMSAIEEHDFYLTGGNVVEGEREDFVAVHGEVPDNIHFGRHDNPDIIVNGDDPDVRVTNNRGQQPLRDGWTVYTTERKLADDPPTNPQYMLIRKGIDTEKFSGWQGDLEGPVVTTTNNIQNRQKAAAQDVHAALIESNLDYRAYGRYNKDGRLNHDEMVQELRAASVYANLSKTISPNALYESLAVGLPIVTIPGYGARDAVSHRYNGLISARPDEFVANVRELVDTPGLARTMANHARETAVGRYSREEFVWRWRVVLSNAGERAETSNA